VLAVIGKLAMATAPVDCDVEIFARKVRDDPPAPYMIIAGLHSIFLPAVDFAECRITNGGSFPIVPSFG
jgi:hypothetical protein